MTTPTPEPLKPCPSCGGTAQVCLSYYGETKELFFVECDNNCMRSEQFLNQVEAIAVWNTRAQSTEPVKEEAMSKSMRKRINIQKGLPMDHSPVADSGMDKVECKPFEEGSTCSSCGTPWTEHLGIVGTCKKVKELERDVDYERELVDEIHEQCDEFEYENSQLRAALEKAVSGLEEIANQDYRGNRSAESQIAFKTLSQIKAISNERKE